MSTNPFYNADPPEEQAGAGSSDNSRAGGLRAHVPESQADSTDAAVDLIRRKLAAIYNDEPDAKQELTEAEAPLPAGQHHSKHQRFMQSLHQSGMPMDEIQAAWHKYYQELPDNEKHDVWQEFYSQSARAKQQQSNRIQPVYQYQPEQAATQLQTPAAPETPAAPQAHTPSSPQPSRTPAGQTFDDEQPSALAYNPLYSNPAEPQHIPEATPSVTEAVSGEVVQTEPEPAFAPKLQADTRPANVIRKQLRDKVSSRGTLKAKHHLQSLLFGLGFGGLVVVILLFSFFNEVVVAPFIQPSRHVSATPIIVGPDGVSPTKDNEVIIPKINVQIPLDFSAQSTNEKEFEGALDKGVAHYPTTALPGQQGNASFFGHSSNNIFNPGKYKFAFVLLNELTPGDMFYLTYNGTVYSYQVYDKKIVEATAVEILNPVPNKKATAMLVTCDPPGTSLRRLAVWGEQISPNPNANTTATPADGKENTTQTDLPGNGPTLWRRLLNNVTGQ